MDERSVWLYDLESFLLGADLDAEFVEEALEIALIGINSACAEARLEGFLNCENGTYDEGYEDGYDQGYHDGEEWGREGF